MAIARHVFGKSRAVEAPVRSSGSWLNAGNILFGLWIAIIAAVVLGGLVALFLR